MSDQKHPNFSYTDFGDMHELGNKQRPRPEEQKVPHTTKHDLEALKATKERLQKEVLQTGRGRRGYDQAPEDTLQKEITKLIFWGIRTATLVFLAIISLLVYVRIDDLDLYVAQIIEVLQQMFKV